MTDFQITVKSGKIHGVGVHSLPLFLGKDHLGPLLTQSIQQHPVGAVADAGFAERAVERDPETGGLGIFL